MIERNAERLGLDERTRAEIRSIADAARAESRGLKEGLRTLHAELRKLLDQETPDLEATLGQAERIGAAETELHKLRLRTMLRIRGLLTPEQRQELVRIHAERRRERGHGPPLNAPPPGGIEPGAPPEPPPDAL
jgi:Spy/CpxP family protein refolding chaperone